MLVRTGIGGVPGDCIPSVAPGRYKYLRKLRSAHSGVEGKEDTDPEEAALF